MNYIRINEKAAAMALDFVVGAEVRVGIERLYELLEGAMQSSFDEGLQAGETITDEDTFNAGYDAGYEQRDAEGMLDKQPGDEDDESEGFYDASEDEDFAPESVFTTDECQCETCTVERAEVSEQDDTIGVREQLDPLPPMQAQRNWS